MNRLIFSILFAIIFSSGFSQDKWKGNTTPTYSELINHLKEISTANSDVELYNMGHQIMDYLFMFVLLMAQKTPPTPSKKQGKKLLFYLTMQFILENQMALTLV